MKPHRYFNEMWKVNFWFFVGWDSYQTAKVLNKHWAEVSAKLHVVAGMTMDFRHEADQRQAIAVYVSKKVSKSARSPVLAHECVHAAHMALEMRGVHPSFENDEVVAYLVETLMREGLKH